MERNRRIFLDSGRMLQEELVDLSSHNPARFPLPGATEHVTEQEIYSDGKPDECAHSKGLYYKSIVRVSGSLFRNAWMGYGYFSCLKCRKLLYANIVSDVLSEKQAIQRDVCYALDEDTEMLLQGAAGNA